MTQYYSHNQPTQAGYSPIPDHPSEHASLLPSQVPPPYSPYPPNPYGIPHHPRANSRGHRHSPPAFLFVFAGMYHFARHAHLWPPFIKRIPKLLTISIIVTTVLFIFTYLPQVALLAFFHGPLAWVNAAFMVLNEAATIITFVAENFMVEEGLVDVFDAVLLDHGLGELVVTAREVNFNAPNSTKALGRYTKSPYLRFSFTLTCKFLLTLLLNFIPVVGPFLYVIGQGYLSGPLAHYRYFQLKGWSRKQEKQWTRKRVWAYLAFGTVHITFQLFPILSIFFLFTTAAGAGLWTVEIERREGILREGEDERERLCHRF
ncbi:hypothetical protein BDZ91DRAFT_732673 [Kalaharituber pfeilii]|nr:hypothetical protein BDZ91DRAFT_732673 [Kalaharituber pfeilii]